MTIPSFCINIAHLLCILKHVDNFSDWNRIRGNITIGQGISFFWVLASNSGPPTCEARTLSLNCVVSFLSTFQIVRHGFIKLLSQALNSL